jgi:hypothetical protein
VTELGQARIDDPGVSACRGEVQVEFALAVPQQDHRRGNTGQDQGRQPAGV